ncbi:class I SAM-dependent methyltransferase [Candidatus Pacearchaeota archaeon]|nr:class I SAM-dependent methyltransferase [Candidatus Pacearchaeota archaeon]
MRGAFDLFGKAAIAYLHGEVSTFYFEDKKGDTYEQSLSCYFDKNKPFTRLERKILSLSKGRILDLGCGIGSFIPELAKRGKVQGIDISPTMIRICKNRGFKEVEVADIFKFKSQNKFDTIVLLDENMGLAGTLNKTKKLLRKLSHLLAPEGQILANIEEVKGDYSIWEARALWKNVRGPWFKWIKINSKFLIRLCKEQGLSAEVIQRDGPRYVIRIRK